MKNWFIEGGEESALAGTFCRECSKTFFPLKSFCPACLQSDSVETCPLSRQGTLHSYTIAYAGPAGFQPPYPLGYVDLPEGVRIFSMLEDCGRLGEQLRIGQTMEIVRHDRDYRFRPSKGEESCETLPS
jgi:uncharacterized OB-fold protein